MQTLRQPGGLVYVADAPNWADQSNSTYAVGISPKSFIARAGRGLRHQLGQLYGVVSPGLIMAQHVFQGLKRGMHVGNDNHAEQRKLAITWSAKQDAYLGGDQFNTSLEYTPAPANCVFAVYVSPNEMLKEYPNIQYWAEHWTWIAGDPANPGAPIDFDSRYDKCIWSRT